MDYRLTHLSPSKGTTYDASFERLPYRKIVWGWEKDVLHDVVTNIRRERDFIQYLDFACGTGRILGFLEESVDASFGIDISPSMLDVAFKKVKRSKLILGDITRERILEDHSIDLVTAFRFFLNAQPALREEVLHAIHRILKDDGNLVFNIHMNRGCFLEKILRAYGRLRNISNENFSSMSITDTRSLLKNTNFEIIDLYHFGVLPIYYEGHRFLIELIESFERLASRISFSEPYSRYIIYICKKRS
ncbi:MAG: hypothetical protein C3F07_15965 [Anaerolineales bacterium]|nr:MAG: hypothetical protein C3F07_15965 [Anaerolineales bacterium]